MKINKLTALLGLLLIPAMASAQWAQDTTFVPAEGDFFVEVHGVAVDGEGKTWIQPFGTTETVVANRTGETVNTRALYVYNADGTPAEFSPLIVLEWADGTTPNDTLGYFWDETLNDGAGGYDTRSGRGIETDHEGNIIVSQWNTLFKIDHKTGKALAKVAPEIGSLTEASVDAAGNVYVGAVVATETPIVKFDSNLENPENVVTLASSFSRDLQVMPDGNTIYWAGYT